jgi:hypothetical protein
MKSIVIEQLEQRGLMHLFNERDFNSYKRKLQTKNRSSNQYYTALHIFDMFIVNATA